ncbi:hypothetical protein K492DRAFT_157134 [Lichtheimia hyalospora FSU 10163]|nr:hypothetical protein K492DRAFT_157134 [Lichtheimia hyalospora FSU 10163]
MNSYLIHTSFPQDFVYSTAEYPVPSNKFIVDDIETSMTGYMPCTTGSMDPLNVSAPLPPQTLPPSNPDFYMAPPLELTWPSSSTGTRPEALPVQAYSYYHETSLNNSIPNLGATQAPYAVSNSMMAPPPPHHSMLPTTHVHVAGTPAIANCVGGKFRCRWLHCQVRTSTIEELTIHIRDDHVGSGKPAYFCFWAGCPRSRKPFTKRHKMHNHMRTHTGERPFQCHIQGCGKRFSRPDSLSTHIKTHSNIRPYHCNVPGCGKSYFHSRSLRKHTRSHQEAAAAVVATNKLASSSPSSSSLSSSPSVSTSMVQQSSTVGSYVVPSSSLTSSEMQFPLAITSKATPNATALPLHTIHP